MVDHGERQRKNPKIGRTPKCELFSLLLLAYFLYKQDARQIAEVWQNRRLAISPRFPVFQARETYPADQCST